MLFVEARQRRFERRRERPLWRYVLFCAAALGALASTQPWLVVQFERLFGLHYGPPAWQSSAGFTCLSTSALVFVMTLGETHTRRSQDAVRSASLMLVALMALALLLEVLQGPGSVRGVSGTWTASFYCGALGAAALLLACVARSAAVSRRRKAPPGVGPDRRRA